MSRQTDIQKRTIGVNFTGNGKAEIVVWAPDHKQVHIVINGSLRLPLIAEAYGYHTLSTTELKPGDRYKLETTEGQFPDPASLSQPDGVHGASEAISLPGFKWTDKQWKNPSLKKYIIYEAHTGTFTSGGTFKDIEDKLDHLKELGITAIELMPVAQFAGNRNWGYDGVFPFAVQSSYGGAEALQHLVNACHEKELAVILDVVYNHMGPEGNYLGSFGPYFTDKYKTPWGQAINFDDAWCDGVREFFVQNALMWFRDFHIDALRLDAVHAIRDFGPVHILREIKQAVNKLMDETCRRHYLIAECDLNDTHYISPLEEQGYGMDAQWADEFHHALRVTAGQQQHGYYADFNGLAHLAKSYKDAYVYTGQYSPHRQKSFGVSTAKCPPSKFVVFSQNHDQTGNRMLGERTSSLVSFEMQKLMAAAVITSPYIPLLFMGEEWSEPNPFLYFASPSDPELAEAIRKGRKAEFSAFHADGEAPDPIAEDTFAHSKLSWDLADREPHKTMLGFYKTVISLRKKMPVLRHPDRDMMEINCNEEHQTLCIYRWNEEQHVVCLMNFSKEPYQTSLPVFKKQWKNILDSASPEWKGRQASPLIISADEQVTVQPESILIYTNCYV
jgi:maltooligosyltrehalose trehalohydrolase